MKMKRLSEWMLAAALLLCGCGTSGLKSQLTEALGAEIAGAEELHMVSSPYPESMAESRAVKLLLYFQGEDCSLCVLRSLTSWLDAHGLSDRLEIYAVVEQNEPVEIVQEDERSTMPYAIYLDRQRRFYARNERILGNRLFRVLLLDGDNRIAMIGNPIASPGVRDLFLKLMDKMAGKE